MPKTLEIAGRPVGENCPVYIVAEIGINHNGDIEIAKKLIDTAAISGCDAVKFQKRTPDLCVPPEHRNLMRETPWGTMTYLDYRYRVEFGRAEYEEIDRYCREKKINWFASCWDEPSIDFMAQFNLSCYKVASASLTDDALLKKLRTIGSPIVLSTGMSTMEEIRHAVGLLDRNRLLLTHTTSSYPCRNDELNLRMIPALRAEFDVPVGYSGHELGLQATYAAVSIGACLVERHITLDRAMWGTDQAASVEPGGFLRLVRDIRIIEMAMGDGVKKVYESEMATRKKLRKAKVETPDE
jgi:N-acetylneuraminate synthase